MDDSNLQSIDLAVSYRIHRLRDRHSQTEGSIKVHRRIIYPLLTYVISPGVLLGAMSGIYLVSCGGAITVMEANPSSYCTWLISTTCRLTDSSHRISLVQHPAVSLTPQRPRVSTSPICHLQPLKKSHSSAILAERLLIGPSQKHNIAESPAIPL